MSILNVSHLSHSYGGREIFEDVSFRLLKGEHVALVGVYVFHSDAAQTLADTASYRYGVLGGFEKGTSDYALSELAGRLGGAIDAQEYETISEAVTALRGGSAFPRASAHGTIAAEALCRAGDGPASLDVDAFLKGESNGIQWGVAVP